MGYLEVAPSPALAPWLHRLWAFESTEDLPDQRIVPDGRPEFIVHLGRPYLEPDTAGEWRAQPAALFAGQLTRPLVLRPGVPSRVVAARFHADGACAFAPWPMREWTDRRVGLDAWWPGCAATLVATLRDAGDPVAALEAFVLSRIRREPLDAEVRAWVERMEAEDDAAPASGIGRRQVERRFATAVGVGPARLASILRFRRAFDRLERDHARPWTEAALAAGYYDQSHFIRDFRRYVGCTPGEFLRESRGLAEALAQPR